MARVILKDPKEPPVKKPRVFQEKKKQKLSWLFKLSIYFNFWCLKLIVYLLNKSFFDELFLKILNNIKRLF
jgi:hypothetical protein